MRNFTIYLTAPFVLLAAIALVVISPVLYLSIHTIKFIEWWNKQRRRAKEVNHNRKMTYAEAVNLRSEAERKGMLS